MMLDTLKAKLFEAQKAKDEFRVSVLRFLLAAVKNKEIELRVTKEELNDEKVFGVIKKQIKMRRDSIESYKAGNRQDLVDKETKEMQLLEEYMAMQPQQPQQ